MVKTTKNSLFFIVDLINKNLNFSNVPKYYFSFKILQVFDFCNSLYKISLKSYFYRFFSKILFYFYLLGGSVIWAGKNFIRFCFFEFLGIFMFFSPWSVPESRDQKNIVLRWSAQRARATHFFQSFAREAPKPASTTISRLSPFLPSVVVLRAVLVVS